MTIVDNKENYINKKLSGENVISVATAYGNKAMTINQSSDNFMVLAMGVESYSFFRYEVRDGRFCVKENEEDVPHQICEYITPEMLKQESVTRWWNCVFYERKDVCTYDNYYNGLTISNDSDVTFEKLINDVANCVSSLPFMGSTKQLFLTGDLMNNPVLRYVLQQQLKQGEVHLLRDVSLNEDVDENEIVILPDRLDQLVLNTNEAVKLKEITSNPISITLPMDSMNNEMLAGIKWKDMFVDEQEVQKDYSVGNMDFKNISLRVECDAFQNVFLAGQDLRRNRKIMQIK